MLFVFLLFTLSMCAGSFWPHISSQSKEDFLGKESSKMRSCQLHKQSGYSKLKLLAEEHIAHSYDISGALSVLEICGKNFFQKYHDPIVLNWCKSFQDIENLVEGWLPGGCSEHKAFLRILLYLSLGDTLSKITIFNERQNPQFSGLLKNIFQAYLRTGGRCRFIFNESLQVPILEHCLGIVNGVLLIPLPMTLDNPDAYYGNPHHPNNFVMTLYNTLLQAVAIHANEALCGDRNVFSHLLCNVLCDTEKSWESEGFRSLVLGYTMLDRALGVTALSCQSVEDVLLKRLDDQRLYDDRLKSIVQELYGADDNGKGAGFWQIASQYVQSVCPETHHELIATKQCHIREELERMWDIKLTNDSEGFQALMMSVLECLIELEEQYLLERVIKESKANNIADYRNFLEAKESLRYFIKNAVGCGDAVYFSILDNILLGIEGCGDDVRLLSMPCKKTVENMEEVEIRLCLALILKAQEEYMQDPRTSQIQYYGETPLDQGVFWREIRKVCESYVQRDFSMDQYRFEAILIGKIHDFCVKKL